MTTKLNLTLGAIGLLAAGSVFGATTWVLNTGTVTVSSVSVTSTGWADTGTNANQSAHYNCNQQTVMWFCTPEVWVLITWMVVLPAVLVMLVMFKVPLRSMPLTTISDMRWYCCRFPRLLI